MVITAAPWLRRAFHHGCAPVDRVLVLVRAIAVAVVVLHPVLVVHPRLVAIIIVIVTIVMILTASSNRAVIAMLRLRLRMLGDYIALLVNMMIPPFIAIAITILVLITGAGTA